MTEIKSPDIPQVLSIWKKSSLAIGLALDSLSVFAVALQLIARTGIEACVVVMKHTINNT